MWMCEMCDEVHIHLHFLKTIVTFGVGHFASAVPLLLSFSWIDNYTLWMSEHMEYNNNGSCDNSNNKQVLTAIIASEMDQ